jgi:hypothetical protein
MWTVATNSPTGAVLQLDYEKEAACAVIATPAGQTELQCWFVLLSSTLFHAFIFSAGHASLLTRVFVRVLFHFHFHCFDMLSGAMTILALHQRLRSRCFQNRGARAGTNAWLLSTAMARSARIV